MPRPTARPQILSRSQCWGRTTGASINTTATKAMKMVDAVTMVGKSETGWGTMAT